jgi:hypothetical protein
VRPIERDTLNGNLPPMYAASSEPDARRTADLGIAAECRLNLLWLVDGLQRRRALEIEVSGSTLGNALEALFERVDRSSSSTEALVLRHADMTFDAVAAYGRACSKADLIEIRRVLKPGGMALLGAANRRPQRWIKKGAYRADCTLRTLLASAADAGFKKTRAYWVEPSLEIPRNVIPVAPDAVAAYEVMRAREFGPDRVRSFLLASGMQRLLYPAIVVVAWT